MNIAATPEAPSEANREDARPALILALSLPLLHRDSVKQGWKNAAPHLWPGLPNMPQAGYMALPGYPFSPEEARACLGDLEAMSVAGLTGVPLQALAAQENRPRSARELEERDALRRFAATGEENSAASVARSGLLLRQAAHKALLWAWLLEERQREVRNLASSFDSSASHLIDALGVEEDVELAGLQAMDAQFGQDADIVPPWKLVVKNAALFMPAECAIIVNDACMAEAVAESCSEKKPDDVDAEARDCLGLPSLPGMVWKKVTLPLWTVVGLSAASPQLPWLHRNVDIVLPLPAGNLTNREATA